eukprot:14321538-Heterocapsa_arctica.AAC.1
MQLPKTQQSGHVTARSRIICWAMGGVGWWVLGRKRGGGEVGKVGKMGKVGTLWGKLCTLRKGGVAGEGWGSL